MRLDKFLKLTRLIKRRSISKELILRDTFLVNKKEAKPSTKVKVDDIIELSLGSHKIKIEILNIKDYVLKEEAGSLYKIISDEIIESK